MQCQIAPFLADLSARRQPIDRLHALDDQRDSLPYADAHRA